MHARMQMNSSRFYQSGASVLLIGFEGSGRKTLGIIASLALKRQYVDFVRYFTQHTGCTPAQYISAHDLIGFKEVMPKVLKRLLDAHSLNCVISGLPQSCVSSQRELLLSFAITNPVIYVRRAKGELKLFSSHEFEKSESIYNAFDNFYRTCSNFDYFNANETHEPDRSTLRLKDVETDFTCFLSRILGVLSRNVCLKDPFSPAYTYALQIPLEQLTETFDLTQLECGADAINLIVQPENSGKAYEILVQHLTTLRRKTRLPVIIDIVNQHATSASYFFSLGLCLRLVPDALTVDLAMEHEGLVSIHSSRGSVKIIGKFHHCDTWKNFQESAQFFKLQAISSKYSMECLQISTKAQSNTDNMDCFEFSYSMERVSKIPLSVFNTGKDGRTSICLNRILSPVVPVTNQHLGITTKQARSALYLSFILEPMKFVIFGSSVSYSLSPAMHNAAYDVCGLPHSYSIYQANDFQHIENLLSDPSIGGIVVTMPFKARTLTVLDYISPDSAKIGAVNTVVVDRQQGYRTVKGYNTDHVGIRESLAKNLSPANSIRVERSALIIGAGGMARATIFALQTLGVSNICIFNRTEAHAIKLVEEYTSSACKLQVLSLEDSWPSHIEQPTMIVSTIPAHSVNGMSPHKLNIPERWLQSPSGGTFVEVAYKPLRTRFIAQIRRLKGWIVVDGLEVLLAQGVAQFELFTGVPAPTNVMKDTLRDQFASATSESSSSSEQE